MNMIDRNRFAFFLLLVLSLFILYIGIIFTYKDQIIDLMRDLFGYRYNARSKAFAGFTIFPFIIIALAITSLWVYYQGKVLAFEFSPKQIRIQTSKLATIDKDQVEKIMIVEKDKNAIEMEIKTKKNSYSIYHFDDTFLSKIKAYFQLQKEDKYEANYKAKTEKKIFELTKNISS